MVHWHNNSKQQLYSLYINRTLNDVENSTLRKSSIFMVDSYNNTLNTLAYYITQLKNTCTRLQIMQELSICISYSLHYLSSNLYMSYTLDYVIIFTIISCWLWTSFINMKFIWYILKQPYQFRYYSLMNSNSIES